MQKLIRVYPHGWTNDGRKQLNDHLRCGYKVVSVTTIKSEDMEVCDYIIEKNDKDDKKS